MRQLLSGFNPFLIRASIGRNSKVSHRRSGSGQSLLNQGFDRDLAQRKIMELSAVEFQSLLNQGFDRDIRELIREMVRSDEIVEVSIPS